jgi:diguanylate cyclase (GGDEF)-like protein
MAIGMAALLLAYAGWQLFRGPSGHWELISDLSFVPVSVAAIGAAWAAARRCRAQPRLRSAWRLIAVACASYLAGDITWMLYALSGNSPYPSAADGFYLAFYPLMLCGLLRFPAPRRNFGAAVRLALDLAVMTIGGAVVVIYVVLGPTVVQSGSDALETAFSIAYPVGDMILLVGLGSVLLRGVGGAASVLRLIAGGLVCFVAADLVYGYIALHSTFEAGDPVDALWMMAMALFAVAGAAQVSSESATDVVARTGRRASWAPYLGVAAGFGVLVISLRREPLMPDFSLVLAAVALATLVSVRQFLTQRDLIATQRRLSHDSLHDALTGLANRVLVIDRAEQLLARGRRNHTAIAALYLDIDGFKKVNDSLGHAAGDELLRVVADRVCGVVREADTVGRLGGDEFVVLLADPAVGVGPELVAERICQALRQPIVLRKTDGRSLSITASIGIALGLRDSADELIRDADLALYAAKRAGKNRWASFESSMEDRLELEIDLKGALDADQFFLLYQPTFDLQSETITGLEALLRWRHPILGVVRPDAFIPLAERTGLIVPIGRWVLQTACEQAVAWHDRGHRLDIAVNVSAVQLERDLVQDVTDTLASTGLDPTALTLEITETTLMRDPKAAAHRLNRLKALGVRIAIDDFGTGYSSLAYLCQFPVDALKIDRSFIAGISSSMESKAVIRTLIQLGKSLGLHTLGEGIEEAAQLRYLRAEHCDSGQGFLFARPLEIAAVDELLASERRRTAIADLTAA